MTTVLDLQKLPVEGGHSNPSTRTFICSSNICQMN